MRGLPSLRSGARAIVMETGESHARSAFAATEVLPAGVPPLSIITAKAVTLTRHNATETRVMIASVRGVNRVGRSIFASRAAKAANHCRAPPYTAMLELCKSKGTETRISRPRPHDSLMTAAMPLRREQGYAGF